MNDVETHAYVASSDFMYSVDIAIVQEGGGVRSIARVSSSGSLSFEEFPKFMAAITPTIRLTRPMAEQLLKGLLELRIPTPSAGAIEGELKATKIHLEDMRKLVLKDRA